MARIAFIGLGNMGGPMAANLVAAGHGVWGFDLAQASVAKATNFGITAASSIAAAVGEADLVISMLPMGEHVLAVWRDIVRAAPEGAIMIDCSTIDVASSRQAHDIAHENRFLSLDAPVSGGVGGAEAGTLTFMCGGETSTFEMARPILEKMGAKVIHCGGAGAGQVAKICNNMVLGATMIATAEAFSLGEKLGLSHQALFDVAAASSGQSWSLTRYCPVPGPVATSPANHGYRPGFAASLMLKDLKLAVEAANLCGAAVPMGAAAAQLYALFNAAGFAQQDFSGIYEFLRGSEPPKTGNSGCA